jgi:hypothetical protein
MYEARDLGLLVRMANFAVANSGRTVDWLHLAGPRYLRSEDRSFFRPLADLEPRDARVFLGIVLPIDGAAGLRRRHATASRYLSDFGVAMYCGFGRQPGADGTETMREHSRVARTVPSKKHDRFTGQAETLRRQSAELAGAIASTEEQVADTLDRVAEHRPPHDADRLHAQATEARDYASKERRRAAEYSQQTTDEEPSVSTCSAVASVSRSKDSRTDVNPTAASLLTARVPRKSRSPSALTVPPASSISSEVATARSVTPAHATSACAWPVSTEHEMDCSSS